MDEDEFDVLPADKVIDLEPLITAALLLEFPLIPLCDEECKGLCPQCGANLNEGPCGCEPAADDDDDMPPNPFAALKDFPSTSRRTSFARPTPALHGGRSFFFSP
mgnify:CR=1 FL=1